MGKTIEEARRRTRAVGRRLRDVDLLNPDEADSMLELEQEGQAPSA